MPNFKGINILAVIFFIILANGFKLFENGNNGFDKNIDILTDTINSRHLQSVSVNIDSNQSIQTTQPDIPSLPSNVTKKQMIQNRDFPNLVLQHKIPQSLSNKEIFQFIGRVLNPSGKPQLNYVRFIFVNQEDNTQFIWNQQLETGFVNFNIQIDLRKLKAAQYIIRSDVGGIKGGPQKIVKITQSVLNQSSTLISAPQRPQKFTLNVTSNEFVLNWKEDNTTAVKKIQFNQAGKIVTYILSNFANQFIVPVNDFISFNQDKVTVSLSHAYSSSASVVGRISEYSRAVQVQFTARAHRIAFYNSSEFQLKNMLPSKIKKGQTVTLSGVGIKSIKNKITILTPLKTFLHEWFLVDKKDYPNLNESTIVQKKILFTEEGVYQVEVTNSLGWPVLNWPIIVGDGFPLLPSYLDTYDFRSIDQSTIISQQPTDLDQQKETIQGLINIVRDDFGVSQLDRIDSVNTLAQSYSDYLVKNKLLSHINYGGQGPQQRAVKAGIKQHVGQLLGQGLIIPQIYFFMQASPSQLELIVSSEWKGLGIGITKNEKKEFVLVIEFIGRDYAKEPLTKAELTYYKIQLYLLINSKYKTIENENTKLSTYVSFWQNQNALYKALNKLETYLSKNGFANVFTKTTTVNLYPNFIQEQLDKAPLIIPSKYTAKEVGIAMKQVNDYSIEIIVAYY